jgi:hypothetical protein
MNEHVLYQMGPLFDTIACLIEERWDLKVNTDKKVFFRFWVLLGQIKHGKFEFDDFKVSWTLHFLEKRVLKSKFENYEPTAEDSNFVANWYFFRL